MKIWFFSDTHRRHELLKVPDVDCMIFCGDESNSKEPSRNSIEARCFFEWYRKIDCPNKIYVPGNHSTAIEIGMIRQEDYPTIKFLNHNLTIIDGVRIFGSPYTPMFNNWSFMKNRQKMHAVWDSIPSEVDILITHGPPKGVLDLTHNMETKALTQCGCRSLYKKVYQLKPDIHAFGHVHDHRGISNYGLLERDGIKFINCSVDRHHEASVNPGIIIDYIKG